MELARAHEELGLAADEAVTAALRSFGNAEQIGRGVARNSGRELLKGRKAVTLFSIPLMAIHVLMIGIAYAYVLSDSPFWLKMLQGGGVASFFSVPVIGGWMVARRLRPHQSPLSVLPALTLAGIGFSPIASVLLIPAFGTPFQEFGLDLRVGLLWVPMIWASVLSMSHYLRSKRQLVTG